MMMMMMIVGHVGRSKQSDPWPAHWAHGMEQSAIFSALSLNMFGRRLETSFLIVMNTKVR